VRWSHDRPAVEESEESISRPKATQLLRRSTPRDRQCRDLQAACTASERPICKPLCDRPQLSLSHDALTPVNARSCRLTAMERVFDVFLCHCGGDGGNVKDMLAYVRRELQALKPIGGKAVIGAFRDEDDLDRIGVTQHALRAAILQSPMGARSRHA